MKETEITVQVFNTFDEIVNALSSKGFKLIESYHMTDWYFSKFDDVSRFSYSELINKSFLVRHRDDRKYMCLCYKNKEFDDCGNVVAEEQLHANTPDTLTAVKIFKEVGLNNYIIVDNTSYVYGNSDFSFTIQIIKGLGSFIEFEENESMKGMENKDKFDYMVSIVNSLGLKLGDDYSCKKVFMMLHNK